MYAIIVDDQNHAKLVSLDPTDGFATNYLVPCGGCGDAVLAEYTTDCVCHKCRHISHKALESKGWSYEHPGYWTKNFDDRITAIAGDSEYRFDFTFCSHDHDQAYGPDFSIDLDDWNRGAQELYERGCFRNEELDELEMLKDWLWQQRNRSKVNGNQKWDADYGSLLEPNGMYLCGTEEPIRITKEMLFDNVGEDMDEEQGNIFCDLCAIMIEFLTKKIK